MGAAWPALPNEDSYPDKSDRVFDRVRCVGPFRTPTFAGVMALVELLQAPGDWLRAMVRSHAADRSCHLRRRPLDEGAIFRQPFIGHPDGWA